MAKYNIPGQNLSFDIPEDGEVYRDKNSGDVVVRSGNKIQRFNLENLGQKLFTPRAADPGRKPAVNNYNELSSSERYGLGIQALKEAGIDFDSIKEGNYNMGDVNSAFSRMGGTEVSTDLSLLKSTPKTTGEVLTQSIAEKNPQGADISSNISGQVLKTPSIEENLLGIKPGEGTTSTPDQAKLLEAAQAGGAPVSAEVLKANEALGKPAEAPVLAAPVVTPAGAGAKGYTGPSIVDYLGSIGAPSDFTSRSKLAQQNGISNYFGTAAQNTQLLNLLRAKPAATPTAPGATPTSGALSPAQQAEYYKTEGGKANPQSPADWIKGQGASAAPGNPQEEIAKIDFDINAEAQKEAERIANETSPSVRGSSKLLAELAEVFSGGAKTTSAPASLAQTFADERAKLGVGELETKLSDVDAKLAKLDADYSSGTEKEEGRTVSMTAIGRRQSALGQEYNRQRRDLVSERSSIAQTLDVKYGIVNTMVTLTGQDYENASQAYNTKFTQAISLMNAFKGIEDSEKADVERKQDNARANVQIMTNLLKEGNVSLSTLPEATRLEIRRAETAAGLPLGFVEAVTKATGKTEVQFLAAFDDAAGNRVQPVVTKDAMGGYSISNVTIATAETTGDITPVGSESGVSTPSSTKKTTTTVKAKTTREQDYATARKFLSDNPKATENAKRAAIQERVPNLTESEINSLLKEAGEKTPLLTREYFKSLYSEEQLKAAAKEAGFTRGGGGLFKAGVGPEGISDYLDAQMKSIEQYRKFGYDDNEILKLMTKGD